VDAAGGTATKTQNIRMDVVPGECLDLKVLTGCFQVHPDYKSVDVSLEALNITLLDFTLGLKQTRMEYGPVPLAGFPWKSIIDANFSKTKGKSFIRTRLYQCTGILGWTKCDTELIDLTKNW